MKIKTGDKVLVIAGKDRGKSGVVLKVDRIKAKVVVEGIGMVKRHVKANPRAKIAGGLTSVPSFIAVSNVMLLDPTSGKPTRIGYRVINNKKVRVSAVSNNIIEDVKK